MAAQTQSQPNLARRIVAEGLGTAMLLATVVGSGIMAERLAGGNVAVALLANASATGAALVALILTFGAISGAHFNPAVTFCDAIQGGISWRDAFAYIFAQTIGAFLGVATANAMFELPVFFASNKVRTGAAQWLSEFVATFGLLAVIWGCVRLRSPVVVPFAVAAYITAACWFTASASFANPAVTLARSLTDSFAGIRLNDVPAFIIAQFFGAIAATLLFRWLVPMTAENAKTVIIPHEEKNRNVMNVKKRVLILCTGNSARSQMAEGLLRDLGGDEFEAMSAGIAPGSVRPEAVEAMREIGIDISAHRSKSADEFVGQQFDYIITVCDHAKESCPVFPASAQRIHRSFEDPPPASEGDYESRIKIFRRVRDEIRQWLKDFISSRQT